MNLGKLTIPLLALTPILAAAAGAGASYAVTKERVDQLQARQAETSAIVARESEKSARAREDAAGQAATLRYLAEAIGRIENKLGTR